MLESLTGPQQVIGFVNEELVRILGEEQAGLETAKTPPTTLMLIGPKGSGKTTTAAKLALHLRKERPEDHPHLNRRGARRRQRATRRARKAT